MTMVNAAKKVFIANLFFCLLGSSPSFSEEAGEFSNFSSTAPAIIFPHVINTAFRVGEYLKFLIKYEFLGAGEATLAVLEGNDQNGRPTFQFISNAKSTKFIDAFFPVRDYNASVVDQDSLVSLQFHQNLKEGHYKVVRHTTLDYTARTYIYQKEYKGEKNTRAGFISEPMSDILSAFFYTRTLPLELGKDYEVRVFSDMAVYPLKVKVHPKLEKIHVRAGTFECLRVQPFFIGDAIFKAKEGNMTIWLTHDLKRMPVLIRSKVAVGAFDAELESYRLSSDEDEQKEEH